MGLLDGDIATIVNDALGGTLLDMTIAPVVQTPVSGKPGKFTQSWPVAHACKGMIADYSDFARANGMPATDRQIVVLANSYRDQNGDLLTPKRGDRATLGRTYDVINVGTDPATAHWALQVR